MERFSKEFISNVFIALLYRGIYLVGTIFSFGLFYYILFQLVLFSWEEIQRNSSIESLNFYQLLIITCLTGFAITFILLRIFYSPSPSPLMAIDSDSYPTLHKYFREIFSQIAEELKTKPFHKVYITPYPDARVYETGIIVKRKHLIIGWPLLISWTRQQLFAVVAHELAHFDNGNVFMLQALNRTRNSISNLAMITLSFVLISKQANRPFRELRQIITTPINLFINFTAIFVIILMRIYFFWLNLFIPHIDKKLQAFSYEAEYYCDMVGAKHYGRNAIVNALFAFIITNDTFEDILNYQRTLQMTDNIYTNFQMQFEGSVKNIGIPENYYDRMEESYTHPSLKNRVAHLSNYPKIEDHSQSILSGLENDSRVEVERHLTKLIQYQSEGGHYLFDSTIVCSACNHKFQITEISKGEVYCPSCQKNINLAQKPFTYETSPRFWITLIGLIVFLIIAFFPLRIWDKKEQVQNELFLRPTMASVQNNWEHVFSDDFQSENNMWVTVPQTYSITFAIGGSPTVVNNEGISDNGKYNWSNNIPHLNEEYVLFRPDIIGPFEDFSVTFNARQTEGTDSALYGLVLFFNHDSSDPDVIYYMVNQNGDFYTLHSSSDSIELDSIKQEVNIRGAPNNEYKIFALRENGKLSIYFNSEYVGEYTIMDNIFVYVGMGIYIPSGNLPDKSCQFEFDDFTIYAPDSK